jgi:hypothetical protein
MEGREVTLAALSQLAAQRAELDRAERELIDSARGMGVGWRQIAAALGLRSRQAAEQRRLRLSHQDTRDPRQARLRQRSVDTDDVAAMRELRRAVRIVLEELGEDWDALAPQALLARLSLAEAADAPAGGMFALCAHALSDLDGFVVPERAARESEALSRFRAAFRAAIPH